MQPTITVCTTLIGDHPGIISVKFGQIPISGSREEVVLTFPYIIQCKIMTPQAKFNFNPIFWPRDLPMQPTEMVWTTLIGDHPGIIPVKFGQNPISGFRGDVV